jgi:hypothetical protein
MYCYSLFDQEKQGPEVKQGHRPGIQLELPAGWIQEQISFCIRKGQGSV